MNVSYLRKYLIFVIHTNVIDTNILKQKFSELKIVMCKNLTVSYCEKFRPISAQQEQLKIRTSSNVMIILTEKGAKKYMIIAIYSKHF